MGSNNLFDANVLDMHNEFDNDKLNIVFENSPLMECNTEEMGATCLQEYGVDEDFMKNLNRQFEKFMRTFYGLDVNWDHDAPWWQVPVDPEGRWSILNNLQRGVVHFVCRKGKCSQRKGNGVVNERYLILLPSQQFTVYGTYGGVHGKD